MVLDPSTDTTTSLDSKIFSLSLPAMVVVGVDGWEVIVERSSDFADISFKCRRVGGWKKSEMLSFV